MEIKNDLNPMFHMLITDADGSKHRMSYDLTHQTYESIDEMSNVFKWVYNQCPNVSMWFTLGKLQYDETGKNKFTGVVPEEIQTIKSE